GWLKRKFGIAGKDISDEAVNEFFERIDWNLLVASNEFEKVLNYVGERENVTIDDVTKVVVKEIETDVFSLLRALEEGKKKKIILIYQDLVKAGNDPTKLLALVSKSLRETYNVIVMLEASYKQVDIAKTLGVSTGRAYYIIKSARSFKKENLEHLIVNLHDLDFKIKSGKVDKNTGFEMFLFGYGK
ncbi:MAG: DNA polymerase III subunit delta, partial [Bacilli bacterium]|nr:DNA polymerase III subunit delta [Bacilli bacterium]